MIKGYGDHVVDQMHDQEDEQCPNCDPGCDCNEPENKCTCLEGMLIVVVNAQCPVHGWSARMQAEQEYEDDIPF